MTIKEFLSLQLYCKTNPKSGVNVAFGVFKGLCSGQTDRFMSQRADGQL